MWFPQLRPRPVSRRSVGTTTPRRPRSFGPRSVEALEDRALMSRGVHAAAVHAVHSTPYTQTNLVSDGAIPAAITDANLVNAWGLVSRPPTTSGASASPFWVA